MGPSSTPVNEPTTRALLRATTVVALFIIICSTYANLSFVVTDPADYRFFPPFKPGVNVNRNRDLGVEYFCIAQAMVAGRGFADPFGEPTGPTAWMPPVLPLLMAGLLKVFGGNRDGVVAVVVVLQDLILIATGLLVMALAQKTSGRLGLKIACGAYLIGLLFYSFYCFEYTHDFWVVLAALDGLIAGMCWGRPLRSWATALGWGAFGGVSALISPVVGLTWLVLSVVAGWRTGSRVSLAAAVLTAGLTLSPWMVRNYLVFGRFIPVKSNLAYELYQTQCLQSDAVLQKSTIRGIHPYHSADAPERLEYKSLGESAFMDRKWQQFTDAVRARPGDYVRRVIERFLAATMMYQPYERVGQTTPRGLWFVHLVYSLPFLSLLVLLLTARRCRLHPAQWVVIGVYVVYLLPYIGASYYDHYSAPLFGIKALLITWAVARLLSRRAGVA